MQKSCTEPLHEVCRTSFSTYTGKYQYNNRLGSSVLECNDKGEVISYEEYYPYGASAYRASRSNQDISLKRYRFTGKERDEETGLDYFGVRYYASWLGRWTSADPGGFVDGLNLYRYARNNPVNGVDRQGFSTQPIEPELPSIRIESNKEELAIDNSLKKDQEIVLNQISTQKIHLLLYSNNNRQASHTETFKAAALKMRTEYKTDYPSNKTKFSGVENGEVIVNAINKQEENSIATFDYYGHGYHNGVTFPHTKTLEYTPTFPYVNTSDYSPIPPKENSLFTPQVRKNNLYKDQQTADTDKANSGKYSVLENINMENFTIDCRIEIHGCKTAGGPMYHGDPNVIMPPENTEDNFVATFSKLLYEGGKIDAVVIGHYGAAGPEGNNSSNDYRQNTRVIFHNGTKLYETNQSGEITKEEIKNKILEKRFKELQKVIEQKFNDIKKSLEQWR